MKQSQFPLRCSVSLEVCLLAASVFWAHVPSAAAEAFDLRHGVIVDFAHGAAYVARPEGGIESVQLSTGRQLWKSSAASLPLAVKDELLAAQAEDQKPGPRLRIVVLDLENRGRKLKEMASDLPADVRALVSNDLQGAFRAGAVGDSRGFLVSWFFRQTTVEGIARDPGEAPQELQRSGTMRVDIASAVVASPSRVHCASAAARPPVPKGAFQQKLLEVGRVRAVLIGGGGGPLTLKRWKCSGDPLPDKTLVAKALSTIISADGRHLLAGERVGKGGLADPEYRWSIFSLETGKRVGALQRHVSGAPFVVWKNIIVFISQPSGFKRADAWIELPLELLGARLENGTHVWQRAIRDTEYRGHIPPSP